jgi:hypothetical protein
MYKTFEVSTTIGDKRNQCGIKLRFGVFRLLRQITLIRNETPTCHTGQIIRHIAIVLLGKFILRPFFRNQTIKRR